MFLLKNEEELNESFIHTHYLHSFLRFEFECLINMTYHWYIAIRINRVLSHVLFGEFYIVICYKWRREGGIGGAERRRYEKDWSHLSLLSINLHELS